MEHLISDMDGWLPSHLPALLAINASPMRRFATSLTSASRKCVRRRVAT